MVAKDDMPEHTGEMPVNGLPGTREPTETPAFEAWQQGLVDMDWDAVHRAWAGAARLCMGERPGLLLRRQGPYEKWLRRRERAWARWTESAYRREIRFLEALRADREARGVE